MKARLRGAQQNQIAVTAASLLSCPQHYRLTVIAKVHESPNSAHLRPSAIGLQIKVRHPKFSSRICFSPSSVHPKRGSLTNVRNASVFLTTTGGGLCVPGGHDSPAKDFVASRQEECRNFKPRFTFKRVTGTSSSGSVPTRAHLPREGPGETTCRFY